MNLATKNTLLIGATALVLGAATTAGVAATRGAGGFEDVAADNVHAEDIAWLRDKGITMGCDGVEGTVQFCPTDATTRAQMASFLRRLAEKGIVDAGSIAGMDLSDLEQHLAFAGPQGDPGEVGLAGLLGATGEIGPQGEAGVTGSRGIQGGTGLQGEPGEIGPQGEAGLQGAPGEIGPQGEAGPTGDTGPAGPGGLDLYFGETLLGPVVGAGSEGMWYWDADAGRAARASVLPSHVFWSGLDCTGTPFTYRSHSDGGMGNTKVELGLGDIVEHVGTYYEAVGGPASVTAASYSYQDQCTNFSSAQTVSDQMELLATTDVVWVRG